MVLVQKWPFFQLLVLGNIRQQNVFYDILERKNPFLGYKNKNFKKSKNWHFCKGVNPWFWSKNWPFFQLFFLGNIGKENVFCDILERKSPLKAIESKSSKNRKIDIFPKGLTHGFGPKTAIFATVLFRQHRQGKCLLRYSRTKKRPL